MPQAVIQINGVVGSNTNLPINTLVQLNNVNSGGELTYAWEILDQPPGTTVVLSSTSIQNPTFTPTKEGSYLIRLIVNQGTATEQSQKVIAAVRQLKTGLRILAAGETTESDVADGWATDNNAYLRMVDSYLGDPGVVVGVNASGGNLNKGEIVRVSTISTIKSGLPGQEQIPGFTKALATTLAQVDEMLCIVEGSISGATSIANGGLMKTRYAFIPRNADGTPQTFAGAPAQGDPVFLSDTGVPALSAGTVRRQIGAVATVSGGLYTLWFNGVGGADITPIGSPYVVYGNPGTLTNAFRIDGTNADGSTGGVAYTFLAGDDSTISLVAKRNSSSGLDLFQAQSEAGSSLFKVTNSGAVTFSALQAITWNTTWSIVPTADPHLNFQNAGVTQWQMTSTGDLVSTVGGVTIPAAENFAYGSVVTSTAFVMAEEFVNNGDSGGLNGNVWTQETMSTGSLSYWSLGDDADILEARLRIPLNATVTNVEIRGKFNNALTGADVFHVSVFSSATPTPIVPYNTAVQSNGSSADQTFNLSASVTPTQVTDQTVMVRLAAAAGADTQLQRLYWVKLTYTFTLVKPMA